MTDKGRVYVVIDIPRTFQFFCQPGYRPKVEACHFECQGMKDITSKMAALYDILMDIEKDGCHAEGCRYVKSWPFKGECNCFQARVRKELHP